MGPLKKWCNAAGKHPWRRESNGEKGPQSTVDGKNPAAPNLGLAPLYYIKIVWGMLQDFLPSTVLVGLKYGLS